MKILSIGSAGKMGKAVVSYLSKDPEVAQVGLMDNYEAGVKSLVEADTSGKLSAHPINVDDLDKVKNIMKDYNVVVVTLPDRRTSYKVMEAAIDARVHLVDILEEYHRRPDVDETEGFVIPSEYADSEEYGDKLHEKALQNDVLVLDGMGFAPGLSNITTGHGINKLDSCEIAIARVGGIPSMECCDKHPLRYMTTWSLEHVLREYNITTKILKDGEMVIVPALTDMELFKFTEFGLDCDLECAVTPGMPSFVYTHPDLHYFAEKTVRWPGHFQGVRTLMECGLLDETPVEYNGMQISPRKFFLHLVNPRLTPTGDDSDVCVMYNTVIGKKDGQPTKVEYHMWEGASNGFTGMARVTSFPAAIGAKMIGAGRFSQRGVRAPEECVVGENYALFIEELKKVNITISEKIEVVC
jgi:lysine 6-dehydrogenase